MDKELFRKTEARLYNYNNLVMRIELLKCDIRDIEREYIGCKGINYGETTGSSNAFNSVVENEVLDKEKKINYLNRELNKLLAIQRRNDGAIKSLRDKERKLVELRYLDNRSLSWEEIAEELGYSEDYCRKDLRYRAIKVISDIIFHNPYLQETLDI